MELRLEIRCFLNQFDSFKFGSFLRSTLLKIKIYMILTHELFVLFTALCSSPNVVQKVFTIIQLE